MLEEVPATANGREGLPALAIEKVQKIPAEEQMLCSLVGEIDPNNRRKPVRWLRGADLLLPNLDHFRIDDLLLTNSWAVHHVGDAALRCPKVNAKGDVTHWKCLPLWTEG